MISYFSKIIASFFYQRKIISKNELTVCEYGFELIISTAIGFGLVLISGIVFNELLSVILFYAVFVCFRFFTGGYHATTHLRCKIVLLICCLFVLINVKYWSNDKCFSLIIALQLFYLITVIIFSPVEHINIPLTNELKIKNRKISIIMAIAIMPLSLWTALCFLKVSLVISWTLFVIAILIIIIPKIQERRRISHE